MLYYITCLLTEKLKNINRTLKYAEIDIKNRNRKHLSELEILENRIIKQNRSAVTAEQFSVTYLNRNEHILKYHQTLNLFPEVKYMYRNYLMKIGAVAAAVALVLAGSWYTMRQMNRKTAQVSSSASDGQIIILDAGHGGMDGGCTSANGDVEKNINLAILLDLRDLLRMSGYTVLATRDTDRSIHDDGVEGIANQKSSDMDNRLELFNSVQDAICLSIHQNQFTDSKYSGAQMFYSDTNSHNAELAQMLQNQFVAFLQPDNKREIKLCGKELFLCYYSKNPTVMAECGFLSNPEEASLLITEDYQQKVAFTLYSALIQYCAENN